VSFFDILALAFGLAADAFAVSVGAGSTGMVRDSRSMLRLSFHFGLFQFLMPVIGWLAGMTISSYISSFDHWIAFVLLILVAVHIIFSARRKDGTKLGNDPSRGIMLVILSIATSIDALAVGLSLAFLNVSIWYPSMIIGIVTGSSSFVGIILGKKFSDYTGKRAAELGGLILIIIGIRILWVHLAAE
jgi:putative Mn2+ efflux pump MntP